MGKPFISKKNCKNLDLQFVLYFKHNISWLNGVGRSGKEKVVIVILIQFLIVGQIGSVDAVFPFTIRFLIR